jgi:hypothetical protein
MDEKIVAILSGANDMTIAMPARTDSDHDTMLV